MKQLPFPAVLGLSFGFFAFQESLLALPESIADLVLGQTGFVTKIQARTATGMANPGAVAVDPATRKVFVADSGNIRVLRYASASALANGSAAEAVFGQADFTTFTASITDGHFLHSVGGICLDANGRLWVVDGLGGRVLGYDSAATRSSSAGRITANHVFGQADFSPVFTPLVPRNNIGAARGICVDGNDRLWVACPSQHRVLRFDGISTKANGAAADGVLGQENYTTYSSGLSATQMDTPRDLAISSSGCLFVNDTGNQRVLRFNNAGTLGAGAPANGVFGQANFTTKVTDYFSNQSTYDVTGMAIGKDDTLWMTVNFSSKASYFLNASTKANHPASDGFVGQLPGSLPANNTLLLPTGPCVDSDGSLWIADLGNNRVLRFPSDAVPPITDTIKPLLKVTTVIPAGAVKKNFTLKGTASDAGGVKTVYFKVNASPYKKAVDTLRWTANLVLKKGSNTVSIYAQDAAGNKSAVRTIKIQSTGK